MRGTGVESVVPGIVCAFALLAGSAPSAGAQDRVSGGINVRVVSGTFGGDQTTTITYAPAVLRIDTGRFEFAGFFPYLSVQDAAGALSSGGWIPMQGAVTGAPNVGMPMSGGMMGGGMMGHPGGQPSGTPVTPLTGATSVTTSGFGDVVGSAGYRLVDHLLTGVQVVATARVKIPTASASQGLGTGRTDVGGALAVRKRFDSGWVYGELGYIVVGRPAGTAIQNAATWSVGGGRQVASRTFVLVSAFGNTPVLSGYQAPAEVGAGLGFRLADHLNFTVIPSVGLTRASPRHGVTVGLSSEIWRR